VFGGVCFFLVGGGGGGVGGVGGGGGGGWCLLGGLVFNNTAIFYERIRSPESAGDAPGKDTRVEQLRKGKESGSKKKKKKKSRGLRLKA